MHGNIYTPKKKDGEAVLWRAVCPHRPATRCVRIEKTVWEGGECRAALAGVGLGVGIAAPTT